MAYRPSSKNSAWSRAEYRTRGSAAVISSRIEAATISPNTTRPEPISLVSWSLHSRWARQSSTSGASMAVAAESEKPLLAMRSAPRQRTQAKALRARPPCTRLTAKHPVASMFCSVFPPLLPENMRMDGSKETIWSQLLGATLGSPAASTVETRAMGPGSRPGCQARLSVGNGILCCVIPIQYHWISALVHCPKPDNPTLKTNPANRPSSVRPGT